MSVVSHHSHTHFSPTRLKRTELSQINGGIPALQWEMRALVFQINADTDKTQMEETKTKLCLFNSYDAFVARVITTTIEPVCHQAGTHTCSVHKGLIKTSPNFPEASKLPGRFTLNMFYKSAQQSFSQKDSSEFGFCRAAV